MPPVDPALEEGSHAITDFGQPAPFHNELYDTIDPARFKGKLAGEVVVITGAAGVIGQNISKAFGNAGAKLVICDLSKDSLAETTRLSKEAGAASVFEYSCDVSDYEQCKKLIEEVESTIGPIHTMVNNAGIASSTVAHYSDVKIFEKVMAVNLLGPMYFNRLVLPYFRKRKTGCVINIASRAGTVDTPFSSSYNVSKVGVIRLVGCIQQELDFDNLHDIHTYALHPGGVVSNMSKATQNPPKDLTENYPEFAASLPEWIKCFKTDPRIVGNTTVFLATGAVKDFMRGRYIDVEQDLGSILAQKEIVKKNDLYRLKVEFLGNQPNDGGMERRDAEPPFVSKMTNGT